MPSHPFACSACALFAFRNLLLSAKDTLLIAMQQAGLAPPVQQVALANSDVHRAHRAAHNAMSANVHACMADNVKGMLHAYPATVRALPTERPRPEALPPAGARNLPPRAHAPFGQSTLDQEQQGVNAAAAKEQEAALWTHAYTRPQFARKRCPDIMITGPSMRGAAAGATSGQAAHAPGVYAYEGSVTTTTTYFNPTGR